MQLGSSSAGDVIAQVSDTGSGLHLLRYQARERWQQLFDAPFTTALGSPDTVPFDLALT